MWHNSFSFPFNYRNNELAARPQSGDVDTEGREGDVDREGRCRQLLPHLAKYIFNSVYVFQWNVTY